MSGTLDSGSGRRRAAQPPSASGRCSSHRPRRPRRARRSPPTTRNLSSPRKSLVCEHRAHGRTLTRIYTRTGDDGTTRLGDFSRTAQDRPAPRRLRRHATRPTARSGWRSTCGEPAARTSSPCCGACRTTCSTSAPTCAPRSPRPTSTRRCGSRDVWVDELEADCDRFNEPLATLRSFVLPGGDRRARRTCTWPARSPGAPSAPPGPRSRRTATAGEDDGPVGSTR